MNKCVPTPYSEAMTGQSKDTMEVQFGEPKSFTGISYRYMGEGLIIDEKMTQKQLITKSQHQQG